MLFVTPRRNVASQTRAFTLIEMLVVVAIIAVLLSILLPSFSAARLTAVRTVCLTRQSAIGVALSIYANDNDSDYPTPAMRLGNRGVWADAYDYRRAHPYGGAADRPALGFGLLVSTQTLPAGNLGDIAHCPTLDNSKSRVRGHCMDIPHPWGFGGSGWISNPNHRIIGGYNFRGTSYFHSTRGDILDLTGGKLGSRFIMVVDTPDIRMRGLKSKYNKHLGYNRVFSDGSGSFVADPNFEIDAVAMKAGGRVDGRGASRNDEQLYKKLESF